LTWLGNTSRP